MQWDYNVTGGRGEPEDVDLLLPPLALPSQEAGAADASGSAGSRLGGGARRIRATAAGPVSLRAPVPVSLRAPVPVSLRAPATMSYDSRRVGAGPLPVGRRADPMVGALRSWAGAGGAHPCDTGHCPGQTRRQRTP